MLKTLILTGASIALGVAGLSAQSLDNKKETGDMILEEQTQGNNFITLEDYETVDPAISLENWEDPVFFTYEVGDLTGNDYDDVVIAVHLDETDEFNFEIWEGGSDFDSPYKVLETDIRRLHDVSSGYFTDSDRKDLAIIGRYVDDGTISALRVYEGGSDIADEHYLELKDVDIHENLSEPANKLGTMTTIGDVNNSGYDDLLIGSPNRDDDDGNPLPVALFEGGEDFGAEVDHYIDYHTPDALEPGSWLGNTLHALGDFNGNDIDDFAIARTNEVLDSELEDAEHDGAIHIFYGQDGTEGDVSFAEADITLETNREDAQNENRQRLLGFSELAVGDFNGSGYKDIAVKTFQHYELDDSDIGVPGIHVYHGGDDFNSQPDHMVGLFNEIMEIGDYEGTYIRSMGHPLMRSIPDVNNSGHDELLVIAGNGRTNAVLLPGSDDSLDENPEVVFEAPDQSEDFGVGGNNTNRQWKATVGNFTGGEHLDFMAVQADVDGTPVYMYRLDDADATATHIAQQSNVPGEFELNQNYPNPFNPSTRIGYTLPESAEVTLEVFDVLGRRVTTLVNEQQSAGSYEVSFDASELSSGAYLYRIETGDFTQTRQMLFVK